MWFKQCRCYRLSEPLSLTAEALAAALAEHGFSPCGSQEAQRYGWAAPRAGGDLVHVLGNDWLISLTVESRLLPTSVIRQALNDKIDEIEATQGARPGKKQVRDLKDQVTMELLPRAFTQQKHIYVWLAVDAGWLVIDSAAPGKADLVVEALLDAVPRLPLVLPKTLRSPTAAMSDWLLAGEVDADFSLDRDCELKSPNEDKAVVRYLRHPLDGSDVREHLANGKLPTRLALTWLDRVSLVLGEQLEIKKLDFLDVVREQSEHENSDAEAIFDSDFALMCGELRRLLPALLAALGGEVPPSTK